VRLPGNDRLVLATLRPRDDELFEPTLAEYRETGERPWRLGSQFYVAFFGGVVAVTAIAWLNAKRLGLDDRRRWLILLVGAVGLAATIGVPLIRDEGADAAFRLTSRVIAVLAFGGMYLLQRSADRVHSAFARDEEQAYASLWVPGLIAVIVGGVAQAVIVLSVLAAF
jgi:predicted permease